MGAFHVSSVFPRLLWRNFLQFLRNNHGIECPAKLAICGHLIFEDWIPARLLADGRPLRRGHLGLGLTTHTQPSAVLAAFGTFPLSAGAAKWIASRWTVSLPRQKI